MDRENVQRRADLVARAARSFEIMFGEAPAIFAYAPGRVNLIGEHTDYNDGFVLPCAIDYGTVVAIGPAASDQLCAVASDYGDDCDAFDPNAIFVSQKTEWKNHVRGIAASLAARTGMIQGANLAIAGNVPQGAGLSSSASMGVALAKALVEHQQITGLSATDLALIAQQSENAYVGTACGIMDQLVSAKAEAGAALLIDCRTLDTMPVYMPEDLIMLVIHSGIERQLADSPFNQRRAECEQAAKYYDVPTLRHLTEDRLIADRGELDDVVFRRAQHVVTEIARTEIAANILSNGDIAKLSELMRQSHLSLRDDFEVTMPAIDDLVAMIGKHLGSRGGVRMTGGGFGGCVVALVPKDQVQSVMDLVTANYDPPDGRPVRIFQCLPSSGARII